MATSFQIDDYIVSQDYPKDYLGGGNNVEVWKGHHVSKDLQVAVKQIRLPDVKEFELYLDRELETLSSVSHCNIVKFYHSKRLGRFLYIFMELCEGNLDKYLETKKDIRLDTLLLFMQDIAHAVNHLHHMSPPVAHRDLKPENLVIVKYRYQLPIIKVTDFGLARRFDGNKRYVQTATLCGSQNYMAPETRPDEEDFVRYNISVDVFALGVIFHAMVNHIPGQKLSPLKGKLSFRLK